MRERSRLLTNATSAFVDHNAIDWEGLLTRAKSEPDRRMVRNLQFLDSLRTGHSPSDNAMVPGVRALWWLLIASGLQTACAAGILIAALAGGESVRNRMDQAIVMMAFCAGSALLYATSRDARTLALLAWFTTIAGLFGRSAVHGLPAEWFSSFDFLFRGVSLEAFAPACVWCFSITFPRVERFTKVDVVAARAAMASWALGIVLFLVNLVATYRSTDHTPLAYLVRTQTGNVYWEIVILALIPAVGTILLRARQAPSLERRKVTRFALAIAGGMAPLLAMGLLVTLWPSEGQKLMQAYPAEAFWPHRIAIGALAAMPLLAPLAIIVDRPFELRWVLHRASAAVILRAFVGLAPAVPFAVLFATLYQHRYRPLVEVFSGWLAPPLFVLVIMSCALLATRSQLLNAFDRFVSRRTAEHQAQLARALGRIRLARGAREVIGVLESELRRGTGADPVTVLRVNPSGAFEGLSANVSPLAADSALAAILLDTDHPIDVSGDGPLVTLLPQSDRDWLAANNVSQMTAVKHRDETMAAVITVGPKRGGLPFDHRDRWLIATLAAAAATWHEGNDTDAPPTEFEAASLRTDAHDVALECPRCGVVGDSPQLSCACGAPPRLAALPERLGETFVVQRRLGAGGMGVVYLARDTALGRDVALKTLPELKPGSIARLGDEARAMAALNHPSLAVIYGLDFWRRTPVLIVEYLPNGTLAHRLGHRPLAATEALSIGISLARALVFMHAHGVLHRDLKPSNIGFAATNAPKLLDFGLASLAEPALFSSHTGATARDAVRVGTPAYLPPEAFDGIPPSEAFDMWALAVVLREAITGVNPFAETRHAGTRAATHTGLRLSSPPLTAFFDRALHPEPSRRFPTTSDLLSALETLQAS